MRVIIKYTLLLFFSGILFFHSAGVNIDSLKNTFIKTPGEKKFNDLHDFIYYYSLISADTSFLIAEFYLEQALKNRNQKIIASANYSLGTMSYHNGYFDKASRHLNQTLKYARLSKDTEREIETLNSLGLVSTATGKLKDATGYFFDALKLCKQTSNDLAQLSSIYQNIGILYNTTNDIPAAIEYVKLSVECEEEIGDSSELIYAYLNLGSMYANNNVFDTAMIYFDKSLQGARKYGNILIEGTSVYNIGVVHYLKNELAEADKYFDEAVQLKMKSGDPKGLAETLTGIGSFYLDQGNYQKAEKICREAWKEANRINYILFNEKICGCIADASYAQGKYKEAYEFLEEEILARDTLVNLDSKSDLAKAEERLKYEVKAAADSVKRVEEIKVEEAKLAERDAKLKQEETRKYALYGGLALVVSFTIYIINRLRVIRRQRDLITEKEKETQEQKRKVEQQKELVEEKNKEILDSITYAKRLQEAILPPMKVVKEYLQESFILYKPKDIVAGDFYFMEPVGDKIVIAAADCTGHGVPGAMVSVVCANALNRTVKEFGILSAEKILDKVRELVLETFSKSESEVKDGMDISLCVIDTKQKELNWAGANNPLWIVKKNRAEQDPLIEIVPDKQPVGITYQPKPFTKHHFLLEAGDSIYIFTDGFEDQFGGDKGKKFKAANMKKLILSLVELPMEEQRKKIDTAFESWRGNLEQLDDVCVIGVRL